MSKRTIEEIFAELEIERQKEEELSAWVAAQRNGDNTTVPVYTFFSTGKNLVAVVQDFGDTLRLSRFAQCGPMGHMDVKDVSKIGYELGMEGFETEISAEAGQILESWTVTPEWEKGTKQALYLAFWNAFSYHGRDDLYRQMDHASNLDEAIALGAKFSKELGYKVL